MANRKISDLIALTAPVTDDLLQIVDISEAAAADKNKKITYGTFLSSVPLGTAAAPSIAFTGDSNTGIYSPGADQVAIATGGTDRARIDSSGRLLVGTSTANTSGAKLQTSDGLTFPATAVASADPNTLDDYEEGTWTPVVSFGGASVGITGTFTGIYTKIGNVVTIGYRLTFASKGSSTGGMLVSGMPFNSGGAIQSCTGFGYIHRFATVLPQGQLLLETEGTTFFPRYAGFNANNIAALTDTDIRNDTDFRGGIVFTVT